MIRVSSAKFFKCTFMYYLWIVSFIVFSVNNIHASQIITNEPTPKKQVQDSQEFIELKSILKRMTDGHWSTTSYMTHVGSIIRTIRQSQRDTVILMSSNPQELLNYYQDKTYEDCLAPVKSWASQGLWNSLLYKKYLLAFEKFIPKLQEYYQKHIELRKFAKDTPKIASILVNTYIFNDNQTEASSILDLGNELTHIKALKAALQQNINIKSVSFFDDIDKLSEKESREYWQRIKEILIIFTTAGEDYNQHLQKTWNEFLSRTILSNFSADTIESIIKLGADVNRPNFAERPLMNAANKPEIIKLLIKHGAKVNATNPFGKTALFYAIQFGDYDCVKLLIENGADVNQKILNLDDLIELSNQYDLGEYFVLETVADFTPLVYAMRYADKDVQDLLIKHGANTGKAPNDRIDSWISDGKMDI